MCGIAGFERRRDCQEVTDRLLARLDRRGPDARWAMAVGTYILLQTRLAVIDVSDRVTYPMRNEAGDLHLLFNGEIYDYPRHRAQLERRGHRFATGCDAEVVLHGFEEFGVDVLRQLDGMFALAILHEPTGELLLARDAFGIKPLAYTTGAFFAFASEAIALVDAGLSEGRIEETVTAEYLAQHYLAPPATGLTDVAQLCPGEVLRRRASGAVTIERWRGRPFTTAPNGSHPTEIEVEQAFDASVRQQLTSDRPVGVFLSGGLDSSLVLDSAVRSGFRPMAFTIGFLGHGDYDESMPASRFARELGVKHITDSLRLGFWEAIDAVASAFDTPLGDPAAVATISLATLASTHVTVVLTGTGGDDLFGGYYRHRAHLLLPAINVLPEALAHRLAALRWDSGTERRSGIALAKSYLSRIAATRGASPTGQYRSLVSSASSDAAWAATSAARPSREHLGLEALDTSGAVLRAIQAVEAEGYLPGDLLAKEDRATMAFGLEGRVPMLGTELLEIAERLTDRQKVNLWSGKLPLRAIARRRLPRYVTTHRKRGFAVPLGDLLRGRWRSEAVEWLRAQDSALVNCGMVAEGLERGSLAPTDIWSLSVLAGWEAAVSGAQAGAVRLG